MGGCPAGYAGRMGKTASAQELSNGSGILKDDGNNGKYGKYGKYGSVDGKSDEVSAKTLSKSSESDGCPAGYADTASAQELSKHSEMSELPMLPILPMPAMLLLNGSLKSRSRLPKMEKMLSLCLCASVVIKLRCRRLSR